MRPAITFFNIQLSNSRVRSYKKINGKKYYSGWGKVKSVKVR